MALRRSASVTINNIGSRGVHVTSPSWQKIYQTTSHTSDSYPLNYPLQFELTEFSYSPEKDIIHFKDEVYLHGEYVEAQEFESRFFKKLCKGIGAKISASINQTLDSSGNRFDNSIDFSFIGLQEKEYGPFKRKFPLEPFLLTPVSSEPLDFIFIENILEHCYHPKEFLTLLLPRLKRMGILILEIHHPYMKYGSYKNSVRNTDEIPPSNDVRFCFEKNINFWIPETFNAMLKTLSTQMQILYVNKTNERKKDKFITVVQKI